MSVRVYAAPRSASPVSRNHVCFLIDVSPCLFFHEVSRMTYSGTSAGRHAPSRPSRPTLSSTVKRCPQRVLYHIDTRPALVSQTETGYNESTIETRVCLSLHATTCRTDGGGHSRVLTCENVLATAASRKHRVSYLFPPSRSLVPHSVQAAERVSTRRERHADATRTRASYSGTRRIVT